MLELEEKRLRMEERQLEREAQQRREDTEFQLQMVRLMMDHGMHNCIIHLVYHQIISII